MTIKNWLDSKERDYDQGVKLYAAHPTATKALVNNLQRKQTKQMEEKLVYVLEKALAADSEVGAETLKKKGKGKGKQVKETPPAPPAKEEALAEPGKEEAPAEPEAPANLPSEEEE